MKDMLQLIAAFVYFLLLPVAIWGMVLAVKAAIRNEKVYKLRRRVADLSWQYMERTGNYWADYYYKLPSYASMMLGKEPVKLESYFSDEEIKELLNASA